MREIAFTSVLCKALKAGMVVGVLTFVFSALPMNSARASESDVQIEAEEIMADSEAALQEEEDARRRAEDEKVRLEEAKRMAVQEAARAKKVEAEAREKVRKLDAETKKLKGERIIAEKKIAEAKKRQDVAAEKIRSGEEMLAIAREETEKTIAQRDQNELEADRQEEQAQKVLADVTAAKQRLKTTVAELEAAKKRVKDAEVRLANTRTAGSKDMAAMKDELANRRKDLKKVAANLVKLEKTLKLKMDALAAASAAAAKRGVAGTKTR